MRKSTKLTENSLIKIKNSKTKPCDVCEELKILVCHHIEGRKIPNFNKAFNRCYICSDCHTEVHKGLIIVEGWEQTTIGKQLLWHRKN